MKSARDIILISSITGLSGWFIIVPDRKIMSRTAYFTWSEISLGKRAAILKSNDEIVRYLCEIF